MPTQELEREIADEKAALAGNLAELELQAKELVDWRAHVRKNPQGMMGLAFGGGLLLAVLAGSPSSRSRRKKTPARRPAPAGDGERTSAHGGPAAADDEPEGTEEEQSAARDAWETLKGALVGAASARVTAYVADLLPDVHEQLEALRKRGATTRRVRRPGTAGNGDSGTDSRT